VCVCAFVSRCVMSSSMHAFLLCVMCRLSILCLLCIFGGCVVHSSVCCALYVCDKSTVQ